jgi:hypothetical protein
MSTSQWTPNQPEQKQAKAGDKSMQGRKINGVFTISAFAIVASFIVDARSVVEARRTGTFVDVDIAYNASEAWQATQVKNK